MPQRRAAEILIWAIALIPSGAAAGEPEEAAGDRGVAFVSPAGLDTLPLAWLDVSSVTTGVDGLARSEAAEILKEAGLPVIWRRGDTREAGRPGEIRVILVDRLQVKPDSGQPILGATPADPRSQPFVWIHVRSVRAALGLGLSEPSQGLPVAARRDLGVALGRVIAHEIVHALAPWVHHGGELMSACFQPKELTGPRLRVGPDTARAVRTALRRGIDAPTARVAGGGVVSSGVGVSAGPGLDGVGRDLAP